MEPGSTERRRDAPWWEWLAAGLAVAAFLVGGGVYVALSRVEDPAPVAPVFDPAATTTRAGELLVDPAPPRTLAPYDGFGAWIDVFDYDPAYTDPPPLTADDLGEMADAGVRTVYLQAARLDERTPAGLVDPWRLAGMLLRARHEGLAVVGWYLPRFEGGADDLDRVVAIHGFEVLGTRFAGVALDIEWIGGDIDHDTRSERLLALGDDVRAAVGADPVAAITQPPVLMEVVNPEFWPGFPWAGMAGQYDVWMPMSYWSWRSEPYDDGYAYHEESVRRLRANVGDPDAPVHGIGGIGGVDGVDDPEDPPEPLASIEEVARFLEALDDTDSIGGSIYDWNTLEPAVRELLTAHFAG